MNEQKGRPTATSTGFTQEHTLWQSLQWHWTTQFESFRIYTVRFGMVFTLAWTNYGLPSKSISKEQTFAEFESLWAQLQYHVAANKEQRDSLKACLADLAYIYCESKPDNLDIAMQKEWFSAITKLRRNDSVVITKPDKGSGVLVILNKSDYTNKINNILNDETKFKRVEPASTCHNAAAIESRLQKRLLELFKAKLIPEEVYRSIRLTGSQRPWMYGLPKTHKPKVNCIPFCVWPARLTMN